MNLLKTEEVQSAIKKDIEKIDNALKSNSSDDLEAMHRYIDSKYQSCINNWGYSMNGFNDAYGFNYYYMGSESIRINLSQMKAKLESLSLGLNLNHNYDSSKPKIEITNNNTNTNEININISFDEARAKVEDMTSLTDEQTKELIDKINEIEETVKSKASKKSKWEKIKPILVWLADKSFDVGMTLLPLLLQLRG